MKSIFNNSVVRMVRDELHGDARKKNNETRPNEVTSSGPPIYYHHPPSSSSTATDSYSHTASSTAGYSQTSAYPTLVSNNRDQERQVLNNAILDL